MNAVRRALLFAFTERYLSILLALGSSMVLARLLRPEEIGAYSVAVAVTAALQAVRDFGLANYLVQERDLTPARTGTAFSLALLIGGGLAAALHLSAPAVADLFGHPEMAPIQRVLALNFGLLPFVSISTALLRRDLRFSEVMRATLSGSVCLTACSVAGAAAGWGPVSLAWGTVAGNAATAIVAWILLGRTAIPTLRLDQWRTVVAFGRRSLASGVVTGVAMNVHELAIGKLLGFAPVALLSRAQGLVNLLQVEMVGAAQNVAYPALAAAAREGHDLEQRHTDSVVSLTGFLWPGYTLLALLAADLIELMFGSQWRAAAPLVPLLCLAAGVSAVHALVMPLLMGQGRNDLATSVDLLFQPLRVVLGLAVVAWSQSIQAFALYLVAQSVLALALHYRAKQRAQATDVRRLLLGLGKSVSLAGWCGLPCLVLTVMLPPAYERSAVWMVVWSVGSAGAVWLYAMVHSYHPLGREPLIRSLLQRLRLVPTAA